MEKVESFEYLLYKLLEWQEQESGNKDNDMSVLKALKLLFLVSAVDTHKNSQNTLLDSPFDNFVAMPYGHVESDVYSAIKNKQLKNVVINNQKTEIQNLDVLKSLNNGTTTLIDVAVEKLKTINKGLINLSSFDFVELSHRWYSWQKNYRIARNNNTYSHPISIDEIKSEIKLYQL